MANVPVRNLGQVGIITDINPADLPLNAFTRGNNIRFDEGKVKRGPVFRTLVNAVRSSLTYDDDETTTYATATGTFENVESPDGSSVDQRLLASVPSGVGNDILVVACVDGTVRAFENGIAADVTPTTEFEASESSDTWSECLFNGVSVLNRLADIPYAWNPVSESTYEYMENWPDTLRARVIRTWGDQLIALNIVDGGVEKDKSYVLSDIALAGQVPPSWDWTDPSTSAVQNVFAEASTGLVDGLALGQLFIAYTSKEAFLLEKTGGDDVTAYRLLFTDGGVINTNCIVEVERKHFVFGVNDIYIHDGISKQSIADDKVRNYIFNNLVRSSGDKCFVEHDEIHNEVLFGYVSADPDAAFVNTTYCNRLAVFNYVSGTWTFYDAPNILGMARANSAEVPTYEYAAGTYATTGGSYKGYNDDSTRTVVALGVTDLDNGLSESRLYGLDDLYEGRLVYPVDAEALTPAFVERTAIDMDEIGGVLRGYKVISSIFPTVQLSAADGSVKFQFGSTLFPTGNYEWSEEIEFDPSTDYKVDTGMVGGRYLGYRIVSQDDLDFQVSGFDAEIEQTGRR